MPLDCELLKILAFDTKAFGFLVLEFLYWRVLIIFLMPLSCSPRKGLNTKKLSCQGCRSAEKNFLLRKIFVAFTA